MTAELFRREIVGKEASSLVWRCRKKRKLPFLTLYIQISQSATKHSFPYLDDDVAQAETKHVIY